MVAICIIAIVLAAFILLTVYSAYINRIDKPLNKKKDIIWEDRKHTFLGFPLSFTKYSLTKERLFITTGFFSTVENEVRLYRILDLQLRQSLFQKLLGLGTIIIKSSDKSMHNFTLNSICQAKYVKEVLSDLVELQRKTNRIMGREFMDYDEAEEES